MNEYLTEKELCKALRVSRYWVYHLRKRGMPFRKIGRGVRYVKQEVDDWLTAKYRKPELSTEAKENCHGKRKSENPRRSV